MHDTFDYEHNEQEVKNSISVCIPDSLVSSDMNLMNLERTFETAVDDFSATPSTSKFSSEAKIKNVYWLSQNKTREHDKSSRTIDKVLLKIELDGVESFLMVDVFFEQNSGYYLKALGSYSSVPKVLSANLKHNGELVAEKSYRSEKSYPELPVYILPSDKKFAKRANPLFFWLELDSLLLS